LRPPQRAALFWCRALARCTPGAASTTELPKIACSRDTRLPKKTQKKTAPALRGR
jgi:hypothetical protein